MPLKPSKHARIGASTTSPAIPPDARLPVFVSTLKGSPSDAEVTSQKLMLRAGMIRKVAAGSTATCRSACARFAKVEAIIREEMNRAGAMELTMPLVQPAELWQETGRWDMMVRRCCASGIAMTAISRCNPPPRVVTDIARRN